MPLGQVVDRLGWGYLEPVLCQWRGEENEGAGSQGKEPVGSGSLNTLSTGVGHAGGSRQGPVSEKRRGRDEGREIVNCREYFYSKGHGSHVGF